MNKLSQKLRIIIFISRWFLNGSPSNTTRQRVLIRQPIPVTRSLAKKRRIYEPRINLRRLSNKHGLSQCNDPAQQCITARTVIWKWWLQQVHSSQYPSSTKWLWIRWSAASIRHKWNERVHTTIASEATAIFGRCGYASCRYCQFHRGVRQSRSITVLSTPHRISFVS